MVHGSPPHSEDEISFSLMKIINETGYLSIVTVLRFVQSPHLSRIAKFIGRSKSTTHATIESLLQEEPAIIQMDMEKTTNTKGRQIFYDLTQFGHILLEVLQQQVEAMGLLPDPDADLQNPFPNRAAYVEFIRKEGQGFLQSSGETIMKNFLGLGMQLNHNIYQMAVNQYIELAKSKANSVSDDQIGYGALYSGSQIVKFGSFGQVQKVQQLVSKFFGDLIQLNEEFVEENKAHIFTGELDEADISDEMVAISLAPISRE